MFDKMLEKKLELWPDPILCSSSKIWIVKCSSSTLGGCNIDRACKVFVKLLGENSFEFVLIWTRFFYLCVCEIWFNDCWV